MSMSGGILRTLDIISVRYERHMDEQRTRLMPGSSTRVTLPFVDLTFENHGWGKDETKYGGRPPVRAWDRVTRKPFAYGSQGSGEVSYGGFAVGYSTDTGNDFSKSETGDYRENYDPDAKSIKDKLKAVEDTIVGKLGKFEGKLQEWNAKLDEH